MINKELENRFTQIAINNEWGSKESVSGSGSEVIATHKLRYELIYILEKYNIKSILDLPCGDCNWIKLLFPYFDTKNIEYIGADIVRSIVDKNHELYVTKDSLNSYYQLDLVTSDLTKVDLIFTRDCLGHLSTENALKALENCKRSGSKWLLTTCFTRYNIDQMTLIDGGWIPINLMNRPFNIIPELIFNEDCKEGYPHYQDKCMILIDLEKL